MAMEHETPESVGIALPRSLEGAGTLGDRGIGLFQNVVGDVLDKRRCVRKAGAVEYGISIYICVCVCV
jgi:hypothetical protein